MKTTLLYVLLMLLFGKTLSSQNGFVHVKDHKLVDGANGPLRLEGVNLGGWLLWEGWIWGGKFKSETSIREKMEELFGKEQSDKYIEQYRSSFITSQDIKAIADLGLNVVRVPINHSLIEKDETPGKIDGKGFRYLDSVVAWCKRYKIYAVLDLHSAPGGQSPFFIADPGKKTLWKEEENKRRTFIVWKAIATRYKQETCIAGYDLLNEPIPSPKSALVPFYKALRDTIRSVDKNHMLIVEGGKFARDFGMFEGPIDDNQIFSFHFYTWITPDAGKKLQNYHDYTTKLLVPMWCGEWGEDAVKKLTPNAIMLKNTDFHFCGSALWTWKKVETDTTRPATNRIIETTEQNKLINWLNGGFNKPSLETAKKGMEDFLMNVRYEANIPNRRMYSLLGTLSQR